MATSPHPSSGGSSDREAIRSAYEVLAEGAKQADELKATEEAMAILWQRVEAWESEDA